MARKTIRRLLAQRSLRVVSVSINREGQPDIRISGGRRLTRIIVDTLNDLQVKGIAMLPDKAPPPDAKWEPN